ncbi:acyltransferase [uncultured Lactobacillus sp.]|uniref:acyltransferase n=1 Tax=uncultured Lactobacillus sp. TaxID=153152 RepID=UPI0025852BC7|nr:acyltransferase [uncultured Lactobacillus sp.]
MKLFSAVYHSKALLKKCFLKTIYGKKVSFGSKVTWRRNFSLVIGPKAYIKIGNNSFFNHECTLDATTGIEIGEGTLFGENVKVYDHNHRFNDLDKPIKEQGYSSEKIVIGNHCWIGSNAVILKGVHIGDNSVIGAGCIISTDVPKNTIVKVSNNNLIKIRIIPKHK